MPRHDVSDGFDPSFWDTVLVVRQPETVGVRGRNSVAEQVTEIQAVVESLGGATSRDEDYQVGEDAIRVSTFFRLRGPTPGHQPDVVIVDDAPLGAATPLTQRYRADPAAFSRYLVTNTSDFSRYGAGFTTATATLTDLAPQPPSEG